MQRVVVRPRVQVTVLIVVSAIWTLLGIAEFTSGDVVAKRDWGGLSVAVVLVATGLLLIWRTTRLGVEIGSAGIRIRSADRRDRTIAWSEVERIECDAVEARVGLTVYAPVLWFADPARGALPVPALGSYRRADAEQKAQRLREFKSSG